MEYLAGVILALAVSISATLVGFDRDRAFYPTLMVVIASYYGLFALMGGSVQVLGAESIFMAAFLGAAVLGFRMNLWIVVVALAAHGVFDFVHGYLIVNPGVPVWWPAFCATYDVAAASYLAWLIKRSRINAHAA